MAGRPARTVFPTENQVRQMPMSEGEDPQAAAERIERENPRWIVVFGAFTRQFVGFPRFRAAAGTVVTAGNPTTISDRIKETESRLGPGEQAATR